MGGRRFGRLVLVMLWALLLASCDSGDEGGEGTLTFTIWGEAFIEEGIPADEFVDGWSVTFDQFVVVVHSVEYGAEQLATDGCAAFDLVRPGPLELATAAAPSGFYEEVAYVLAPAGDCLLSGEHADADILAEMAANGYGIYVAGRATKEGVEKRFAWGFSEATRYDHCHADAQVVADAETTVQLTIHGDHLFYNSLTNPEAGLAFDVIAGADVDGDGEVTQTELSGVGGAAFQALDDYDVGDMPVDNLAQFIAAQVATLGHIQGEGHCLAAPGK